MLSRAIEIRHILSEYRFYFFSITFLLALLVYNRYEILAIEKQRLEIDNTKHKYKIVQLE
jgi:hypothetical protein